jgi:hypothetical protein
VYTETLAQCEAMELQIAAVKAEIAALTKQPDAAVATISRQESNDATSVAAHNTQHDESQDNDDEADVRSAVESTSARDDVVSAPSTAAPTPRDDLNSRNNETADDAAGDDDADADVGDDDDDENFKDNDDVDDVDSNDSESDGDDDADVDDKQSSETETVSDDDNER